MKTYTALVMKQLFMVSIFAICSSAFAETDPAPSGVEKGHIYTDGEHSIETPGKDHAPIHDNTNGQDTRDFTNYDPDNTSDDDKTIEYVPPQ